MIDRFMKFVVVFGIACFVIWMTLVSVKVDAQESNLVDAPIVSDKLVEVKDEGIQLVDKDEVQRLFDKMTLRIQRLENEVADLRITVASLQSVQ